VFVVSLCDYAWWPASSEYAVPNCTVLSGLFVSLWDSWVQLVHAALPFPPDTCYSFPVLTSNYPQGAKLMEWTTPQHEEIDLNCEVSSYANAEL
jgi:hypothetical protein